MNGMTGSSGPNAISRKTMNPEKKKDKIAMSNLVLLIMLRCLNVPRSAILGSELFHLWDGTGPYC